MEVQRFTTSMDKECETNDVLMQLRLSSSPKICAYAGCLHTSVQKRNTSSTSFVWRLWVRSTNGAAAVNWEMNESEKTWNNSADYFDVETLAKTTTLRNIFVEPCGWKMKK
jgi:hypothetical protein